MLRKIISGGQTGADQGALDAAVNCNMPHGGSVPRGRRTESGPLPAEYNVREMATARYPKRTRQNVLDADGTAIFFYGKLTGGSKYTLKCAKKCRRPHLALDLDAVPAFEIIAALHAWVVKNSIEVLNVAGPRASKAPKIYSAVKFVVTGLILLDRWEVSRAGGHGRRAPVGVIPRLQVKAHTLDEAANRFISELPVMDRVVMANMEVEDIDTVLFSFSPVIKYRFFHAEASWLLSSCRDEANGPDLGPDDAATLIVHRVWEKLRENQELRLMR